MLTYIQRHLGWKFFLSYLVVIIVVIIVLASATEFIVPSAFDRHMLAMAEMMGPGASRMEIDLFNNFRNAVNEALVLAAIAAFISAVVVSLIVSRQIVAPISQMMIASQRIADGEYKERVEIRGNVRIGDIDELGELALSFNQMTQKLEQGEIQRKQLIGDIAHELRTPLTTIKGSMEGLIDGVLPAEDDTFQQVYREADRLQRLVNDLQDLNRVEAGAFRLDIKPHSVSHLIENTKARLEYQFQDKGVNLILEIDDKLPQVLADEDRIGQVLLNITGNALQYTPTGGTVTITAHYEGDNVHVSILDTGVGLAPEQLPHIFTRFYRVDKSRSRIGGGSGIGLTIAKYLVEAQGGRIWVSSPGLGKGATFSISLPLAH